jgi:hypothetical protein
VNRDDGGRQAPLALRPRLSILVMFVGIVVSAFAVLLAVPLALGCRRARRLLVYAALGGAALSAFLAPTAVPQAAAAVDALVHPPMKAGPPYNRGHRNGRHRPHTPRAHGRRADPVPPTPRLPDVGAGARAAWPHVLSWWRLLLPTAPVLALLFDLVRAKTLDEQHRRTEQFVERRQERVRRAAVRRAEAARQTAVVTIDRDARIPLIGAKVAGDCILPERRGMVGLPLGDLHRHTLVIGPSGSGKTETLLRLAYGAATVGRWPIFYIDAKADGAGARRFAGLMMAAGHRCAVFPHHRLDCWRGDGRAVYNRLIELVSFSTEGDAAYYRDVAKRCLRLACCATASPPRSGAELRERLVPDTLLALDDTGELAKLGQRELSGVALRYGAFFDSLGDRLDGGYALEDVDAAYLMLDSLALKEDAQSLARLVIEDFAHFASQRKPGGQPALLIVDELSAIADAARIVDLVERMRSFGVGVVLAPQVESGMGADESVADRIVQNADTVFLHAMKRPDSIIELAGTRREVEASWQHDRGAATGMGTGRVQHVFNVHPNDVRGLAPGECFVIRSGKAVRLQVARAPQVEGPVIDAEYPTEASAESVERLRPPIHAMQLRL